jgi:acyl carrier protein
MTDKFLKITCEFIRDNFNTFTYAVNRFDLCNLEQIITADMSMDDFGADSLDFTMYVMDLEEGYDIEIDDEELVNKGTFGTSTKTFGEIYNIIVNKKDNK